MTSLPPLPDDMKTESAAKPEAPSPFSGGLSGLQSAYQMIEQGYKTLAGAAPSLAPFCADAVTKLRMAIPNALGTGGASPADQGGGMQQAPAPGGMAVPPLAMQ